jgi:hypothetical protein
MSCLCRWEDEKGKTGLTGEESASSKHEGTALARCDADAAPLGPSVLLGTWPARHPCLSCASSPARVAASIPGHLIDGHCLGN